MGGSVPAWTFPVCEPTPSDVVLLEFLLGPDQAAPKHWDEWSATTDLDDHSSAVYALLPAMYKRLQLLGIEHPWLPRLKGVYRRHWAESALNESTAAAVEARLLSSSLPVMVDPVRRLRTLLAEPDTIPLGEARVVIGWADTGEIHRQLASEGWRPPARHPASSFRSRLGRTDWTLEQAGRSLRVSNFVSDEVQDPRFELGRWRRAALEGGLPRCDLLLAILGDDTIDPSALRWAYAAAALEPTAADVAGMVRLLDEPPCRSLRACVQSRLVLLGNVSDAPWVGEARRRVDVLLDLAEGTSLAGSVESRTRRRLGRARRWTGRGMVRGMVGALVHGVPVVP